MGACVRALLQSWDLSHVGLAHRCLGEVLFCCRLALSDLPTTSITARPCFLQKDDYLLLNLAYVSSFDYRITRPNLQKTIKFDLTYYHLLFTSSIYISCGYKYIHVLYIY